MHNMLHLAVLSAALTSSSDVDQAPAREQRGVLRPRCGAGPYLMLGPPQHGSHKPYQRAARRRRRRRGS